MALKETLKTRRGEQTLTPLTLLALWLGLCALAGLSWWLWTLQLGRWSLPVGLAIAFAKAGLIVTFFMRLREHGGASRTGLLVTLLLLGTLGSLTLAETATRFAPTVPPGPLMPKLEPDDPALTPGGRLSTQPEPHDHPKE
jgi:cytochrome c oxidase subunit 4